MVHQYQLNGYNIVLDTCSGSVHVVDEVAYDVIAMYPDHTADEIVAAMMAKYGDREDVTEADLRQCIDDVASLKESGKLWSPDTYENLAFDFKNRNTVVKALCLHVAHTCNLNCSYCFASQGRYQGERALMSFEVGKRAMDFLIENSGSRRNLEVDFFGGEPLMNFDMVKKLVAYCREQEKIHNKNFRFTMTTNGMLIDDDVIDFCNKECHNVVLSLDGRKEVHDRFRKDYAGHGSYDAIVPKFQEFVKKRGDKGYYMRGTFTHYNTDFTNDIFHMADMAYTQAGSLPYGAQRRLEIMRALATSPKLLLLDEPAAGMNPSETAELTETIRRIRDEFNIAVLLIEHDMSLVMGICEGIAVLNFGRIIAKGTPDEIRNNPQVIEAYLGKKEG